MAAPKQVPTLNHKHEALLLYENYNNGQRNYSQKYRRSYNIGSDTSVVHNFHFQFTRFFDGPQSDIDQDIPTFNMHEHVFIYFFALIYGIHLI